MVEEIILLSDYYNQEKEKEKKEERKKTLEEIMSYIQVAGKIIDLNLLRIQGESIDEELRTSIIKHPSILYAEYADKKNFFEFILHKDGIQSAIESAKRTFATTGNESELTILRLMDVVGHIEEPGLISEFEEAEGKAFFRHLPLLTWLWRLLMGNKTVQKYEITAIRNMILKEVKQNVSEQRAKFLAKKRTEIAEDRIKKENEKLAKKGKDANSAHANSGNNDEEMNSVPDVEGRCS
jgi:hypothetical protein